MELLKIFMSKYLEMCFCNSNICFNVHSNYLNIQRENPKNLSEAKLRLTIKDPDKKVDLDNFRPISIQQTIRKLVECVLMHVLESKLQNYIPLSQLGFR
jgi:hypothetical protein